MPSNKVLVVFCDGTGMDGVLADPDTGAAVSAHAEAKGGNQHLASNVLRLSRAIQEYSTDGSKRQIVYYQSGVASFADFNGDPSSFSTLIAASGTVVASKIRDVYAFIAQNYEEGDEIALFGFSRGSYTARKVAGLIDRIGLLTRENLGKFFSIWMDLMKGRDPRSPPNSRFVNIKLVAVYDTVGSVLGVDNALNIKDNSLPDCVDNAIHALSIHENRGKFLSTLWADPPSGFRKDQVLKQVWFSGCHSDVAGCYGESHELGDIALFWMVGEIKDLLNIDLEFIAKISQSNPEEWGTSQPHNSYDDLPEGLGRDLIGHKTRLEDNQITKDSIFHQSFQFSPDGKNLQQSEYMVSMEVLKAKFGADWEPTYAPLNEYEQKRKDNWGVLADVTDDGEASIAVFDSIEFEEEDLISFSKLAARGI